MWVGAGVPPRLVEGDGLGCELGLGEELPAREEVGDALGETGVVCVLAGDVARLETVALGLAGGVCRGCALLLPCTPTICPTDVPEACRFHTTASSGLPAASSNTVIAAITPMKIPAVPMATASQAGRTRFPVPGPCSPAAVRCPGSPA